MDLTVMSHNSFEEIETQFQETHPYIISRLLSLQNGDLVSTQPVCKTASIWNVDSGQKKMLLKGHNDGITYVCQTEDGRVATASDDNTVILWNIEHQQKHGQQQMVLKHDYTVEKICPLASGHLATIAQNNWGPNINLWNIVTGAKTTTLKMTIEPEMRPQMRCVSEILQLSNGQLATAMINKIQIWDLATGNTVMSLLGHKENIISMCQLKDGRLVSIDTDKEIRIWDVRSGNCTTTLHIPDTHIITCQLDDGNLLSVGAITSILDLQTKTCKIIHNTSNTACQINDGRLAIGTWNGCIKILK